MIPQTHRRFAVLMALTSLSGALSAQGVLCQWPGPAYGELGDVAAAGDVNGDAVDDLAYTQPTALIAGVGHLIVRSGVDASILLDVSGQSPGDGFGSFVASVGDVDGDGRADLIVVANAYIECVSGTTAAVLWQMQQSGVTSITTLSDLDNDGVRDWALGAPSTQLGVSGLVRIHSGRTGGVLFTIAPPPSASVQFGYCVAPAGDFDLDGNPDIIVGDPLGGTGNGSVSVHGTTVPGIVGFIAGPPNTYGIYSPWFGASVATPGDVDGDGVPDLLVGSPGDTTGPGGGGDGRVRLLSGASGLTLQNFTQYAFGNAFGILVGTYPDLDGDGRRELVMTAYSERIGCCQYFPAELRIHSSATGTLLYFGERQGAQKFAVVRDLNGDGFPELLCAAGPFVMSPSTFLVLPLVLPPQGVTGCVPKINSASCIPWLDFAGSPSLGIGDDFQLRTFGLIPSSVGLFLFAQQPAALPFGGGILCVGGTIRRSAQFSTGGTNGCTGSSSLPVPKSQLAQLGGVAGSTFYAQVWYRDGGFPAPNDIGLSTGLAITLWP